MKKTFLYSLLLLLGVSTFNSCDRICRKWNARSLEIGDKVDSLNGVYVYYNNSVGNVEGRNVAPDGYNIGLRYQCVEFVKRYYYERLDHKMPDSYGHAKDFFEKRLQDGKLSSKRNLIQYTNPSSSKPEVDDLLVFDGTNLNKYGHVAIISKVDDISVEIIQQNPGPLASSRETFKLTKSDGKWKIEKDKTLGWLRKK